MLESTCNLSYDDQCIVLMFNIQPHVQTLSARANPREVH